MKPEHYLHRSLPGNLLFTCAFRFLSCSVLPLRIPSLLVWRTNTGPFAALWFPCSASVFFCQVYSTPLRCLLSLCFHSFIIPAIHSVFFVFHQNISLSTTPHPSPSLALLFWSLPMPSRLPSSFYYSNMAAMNNRVISSPYPFVSAYAQGSFDSCVYAFLTFSLSRVVYQLPLLLLSCCCMFILFLYRSFAARCCFSLFLSWLYLLSFSSSDNTGSIYIRD